MQDPSGRPFPQEALQIVETALKHRNIMNDDIVAFRSSMFYKSLNSRPHDLGGGAEAWTGFSTSVVLNKDMVSMSIDMSASAFVKAESLENLVNEIF